MIVSQALTFKQTCRYTSPAYATGRYKRWGRRLDHRCARFTNVSFTAIILSAWKKICARFQLDAQIIRTIDERDLACGVAFASEITNRSRAEHLLEQCRAFPPDTSAAVCTMTIAGDIPDRQASSASSLGRFSAGAATNVDRPSRANNNGAFTQADQPPSVCTARTQTYRFAKYY